MSEDYATEITKQAIGKACVALGFKNVEIGALNSLADITKHYIEMIAQGAQEHAELSSRAVPGIHDVLAVLENTQPKSAHWKDLRAFAFGSGNADAATSGSASDPPGDTQSIRWNQPFPFTVAEFPMQPTERVMTSGSADESSSSRGKGKGRKSSIDYGGDSFVPSHLPAYPPAHTYQRTRPSSSSSSSSSGVSNGGGAVGVSKKRGAASSSRIAKYVSKAARHTLEEDVAHAHRSLTSIENSTVNAANIS